MFVDNVVLKWFFYDLLGILFDIFWVDLKLFKFIILILFKIIIIFCYVIL